MFLVAGLGNPGRGYADHRHNVGFMVVDRLAEMGEASFRSKFSGEWSRVELRRQDLLLLKPMTYMNLSGDSVQPCAAFFKVRPPEVIVVHDELDLPFGEVRIKKGGGHGGHNGLRSIIGRMGADFVRVRVGIGRPPADFRGDVADFVLGSFSASERAETLEKTLESASKAVLDIPTRGLAAAMKIRNTRKKKPTAKKTKPLPSGSDEGTAPMQAPSCLTATPKSTDGDIG